MISTKSWSVRLKALSGRRWAVPLLTLGLLLSLLVSACQGIPSTNSPFVKRLPALRRPGVTLIPQISSVEIASHAQYVSSISAYISSNSDVTRLLFAIGADDYQQLYDTGLMGQSPKTINLPERCLGRLALVFNGEAVVCKTESGLLSVSLDGVRPSTHYIIHYPWGYEVGGVAWTQADKELAVVTYSRAQCKVLIYAEPSAGDTANLLFSLGLDGIVAQSGAFGCPIYRPVWSSDGQVLLITVGNGISQEKIVAIDMSTLRSNPSRKLPSVLLPIVSGVTNAAEGQAGTPAAWSPNSHAFAYVGIGGRSIVLHDLSSGNEREILKLASNEAPSGRICDLSWLPNAHGILLGLCGSGFGDTVSAIEDVYLTTVNL